MKKKKEGKINLKMKTNKTSYLTENAIMQQKKGLRLVYWIIFIAQLFSTIWLKKDIL